MTNKLCLMEFQSRKLRSGCKENFNSALNFSNSPFFIQMKISSWTFIARGMYSHLSNNTIWKCKTLEIKTHRDIPVWYKKNHENMNSMFISVPLPTCLERNHIVRLICDLPSHTTFHSTQPARNLLSRNSCGFLVSIRLLLDRSSSSY